MKITENGQKIINYLRQTNNKDAVAADIANAIGLTPAQVNGSTNALKNKGLAYRETVDVEGSDKPIKFIKLTDEGFTVEFTEE